MQQLRIFLVLAFAFLAAPLTLTKQGFAAIPADDRTICARAIETVESRNRLPLKLLDAVSLVESGRWAPGKREKFAWPWTINAEGKSQFFATKQAAIRTVRRLQKRGVESIDVGCMQVNLFYHPDAFASLDKAFDPVSNVTYAARFLGELRRSTRSWMRAVAQYHSSLRSKGLPYWSRVRKTWDVAVRRHYREKREAHIRAYRARRVERLAARRAALAQAGHDASVR